MMVIAVSLVVIGFFLFLCFLFQEIHFIYLKDLECGAENIPSHTHKEINKTMFQKLRLALAHRFPILRRKFHITYDEDKWVLKKQKSKKIIMSHENKEQLIDEARVFVKKLIPSQLIIHKKNGRFQTEYTYGNDPRETKG